MHPAFFYFKRFWIYIIIPFDAGPHSPSVAAVLNLYLSCNQQRWLESSQRNRAGDLWTLDSDSSLLRSTKKRVLSQHLQSFRGLKPKRVSEESSYRIIHKEKMKEKKNERKSEVKVKMRMKSLHHRNSWSGKTTWSSAAATWKWSHGPE